MVMVLVSGSNRARAAISVAPGVCYPVDGDFSPSDPYPEYPFPFINGGRQNPVYALVRRCLREYGCDAANYATHRWNPLGHWIKPGDRVFLLPNFVMHRRQDESLDEFQAKCTHGSVLRAVVDYAAIACGDPSLISIGNAPIQACDYDLVVAETGARAMTEAYMRAPGVALLPHDLRATVTQWTNFGALRGRTEHDAEASVSVDLGGDSWLDPLYRQSGKLPQVRVGDYPPKDTMSYHGAGRHVYVLNRRVLEADVILNIPKLKTHQKVGLTCALKGVVGAVARKECLAHHRRGGPRSGGDEYPHDNLLRNLASSLIDFADGSGTGFWSNSVRFMSKQTSRILRRGPDGIMGGAWFGNDTAWRMVLDVVRILRYARADGSLCSHPKRKLLSIVDGVVAGEGEGPLRPRPRKVGAVVFSPDMSVADAACALLAGYRPSRIPLIHNSFQKTSFPITESDLQSLEVVVNGRVVAPARVHCESGLGRPLLPPKGWKDRIENHVCHEASI
jgi:uncharacterized protein (DUF362 family)